MIGFEVAFKAITTALGFKFLVGCELQQSCEATSCAAISFWVGVLDLSSESYLMGERINVKINAQENTPKAITVLLNRNATTARKFLTNY